MRMQHPLYGMGLLSEAWEIAGSDPTRFPGDYLKALLTLGMNLDKLLAPVFFTVPEDDPSPEWQRLIFRSTPYCGCEMRRLLVPRRGRTRFVANTPPQTVTIRYEHDGEFPSTYYSEQVVIAPHGGDQASAFVSWGYVYNELTARQLPFQASQQSRRLIHNAAGVGYDEFRPACWRQSSYTIGQYLDQYGDLVFTSTYAADQYSYRRVPTCAIVGVGWQSREGSHGHDPVVTLEIDAGVKVITNPDYNLPPHVCSPGN